MDFFESEKTKFISKTVKSDNGECLLWTGYCNKLGNGVARYKNSHGVWQTITAHRFIIMLEQKCLNE